MSRSEPQPYDEQISKMWQAGASKLAIGREVGTSASSVERAVVRLGLPARLHNGLGRPATTPEVLSQIRLLWNNLTNPEIADRLGISETTLKRGARQLGLPMKNPNSNEPKSQAGIEEARLMRRNGHTIAAIMKRLGWSETAVRRHTAGHVPMKMRHFAREGSNPKQVVSAQPRPRSCMSCRQEFRSEHVGHRMCPLCRRTVPDRDTPYAV